MRFLKRPCSHEIVIEEWADPTNTVAIVALAYLLGQIRLQVWFGPEQDILLEM